MNVHGSSRHAEQALVIAVILVIGSLHLARSAIVPVLFAMFLALLLSPAVALARLRVPRCSAIVVVTLVAAVALAFNATWRPARGWLVRRRLRCAPWNKSHGR